MKKPFSPKLLPLEIENDIKLRTTEKLIEARFLYADDKKRNKVYRAYDLLDILR